MLSCVVDLSFYLLGYPGSSVGRAALPECRGFGFQPGKLLKEFSKVSLNCSFALRLVT